MIVLLFLLFAFGLLLVFALKKQKHYMRVHRALGELSYWQQQKALCEKNRETDLDLEKIEIALNRLSFAKNSFAVKVEK